MIYYCVGVGDLLTRGTDCIEVGGLGQCLHIEMTACSVYLQR